MGIKYIKAKPTEYVLHYRGNKLVHAGAGISFYYFSPSTNIVKIPINSANLPFIFNEITMDYQPVTVQGQLSFRIINPKQLSEILDFTLNKNGGYSSDDPAHLLERLVHIAHVSAQEVIGTLVLGEILVSGKLIVSSMQKSLQESHMMKSLGVEILDINILSIKTSPEMTKALESNAREALLQQADLAIYKRRNTAVEQERKIKENELQTEIKIEEEKRKIRETKMIADIAVEEKRTQLMIQQIKNDNEKADSQAYAAKVFAQAIKDVEWQKLLVAFSGNKLDARFMIAAAFQSLAENAQKIGSLNVSPELLNTLSNVQSK